VIFEGMSESSLPARFNLSHIRAPLVKVVIVLSLVANAGHSGNVVVDNSFGTGKALTGPNYTIPDTIGRRVGNNLFHSFSRFDLDAGDVADFTGPASIQNVLARVTGGTASKIDGTIQCSIPGANLFLMNPFGVMFGKNAKVDVSGSFAVTTAGYLKLADGGRFDARHPAKDILTAAPVSAFGFLGPSVAPIVLQGPSADETTPLFAQMTDGKTFLAVGGQTKVENMQINAPSGRIAFISVGSAGKVFADINDPRSSIDASGFLRLGNIGMSSYATFDVSGDPGGRIEIQGQNLKTRESMFAASTLGLQDGLGIDFTVRDSIKLQADTYIFLDTSDAGAAGALTLRAKSLSLHGDVSKGGGPVNIVADTFGPGRAGDISINADSFVMRDGAQVTAESSDIGDGGDIKIAAKSMRLDGKQSVALLSTTSFEGKAGRIMIQTDSLTLRANGQITAEAFGANPAGTIQIAAKQLTIDDNGGTQGGFAGISVDSETSGLTSGQRAGDILINTENLDLGHGGRITSSSATDNPGGDVIVNASHAIRLADSEIAVHAGGDGGNVVFASSAVVDLFQSRVSAQSVNGNGGNIKIGSQFVILNESALNARAVQGNGGSVNITSDYFLRSDSRISVSSDFGLRGSVSIVAPDVDLSGSLVGLKLDLLSADTTLQPSCAERLPGGISSFVTLDRGGVAIEPEGLLPADQMTDAGLQ